MLQERDLHLIEIEKSLTGLREWYHPEGYFVKEAKTGVYGTIAEVLVSDIAHRVDISHIQYKREKVKREDGSFMQVSICRDYRKVLPVADTITLGRYLLASGHAIQDHYDAYKVATGGSRILRRQLDEMIFLDCLTDNRGRMLENVHLIKSFDDEITFAPLHDHESSLFASLTSQDLEDVLHSNETYEHYVKRGGSVPGYFGNSHFEALRLTSTRPSSVMRLDVTMEEWRTLVGRYQLELGDLRVSAIVDLLSKRQDMLYTWDQTLKEGLL